MDKLFRKFRKMRREGLFLYFIIGLYLLYTARGIFRSLSETPGRTALLIVFIIIFALAGLALVLVSGYFLLRAYYMNIYMAALEEEQAKNGSSDAYPPPAEKKLTWTDKYLDFMYRIFKIKQ